ncbi:unnamed protein product [Rotaria sordida]|uniref:Adenosine deaminase n=1 Tax=Rotaria sordida TaxID=392033 RepID=A0A819DRM7_9BILA|nr:unnamed protein product [Rotaria sordida]CAF3830689.1 unnamed protein product [Rotaria sordida]
MNLLFIISILFFLLFSNIILLPLPLNQYAYMLARERIKQYDRGVQAQNNLTSKEKVVNLYLELLQANDYMNTKNYFYPSRPIEKVFENITKSSLYQFLISLPKGGNLHIHESQVLDRKLLLEHIMNSSEYDFLYICDQDNCTTNKYYLNYFKSNPSSEWTKVKGSNWTIPEILKRTTLTGILNNLETPIYATDTEGRWHTAAEYGVFDFYGDLVKYNVTRFNYMKLVLDQALEENIQLLEFRRGLFGSLYYLTENNTKILINPTEELDLLLKFKKEYISKNPKLIDFIFVIYSSRNLLKEQIKTHLNNIINLHRLYPDFIRGYDMVGEEDQGHTLLFHSDTLINAFNYTSTSNGSFNFLFHSGETNWPENHIPSVPDDSVSAFENIYDALVFRTHRIGHGLSLTKRPDLYQYIRQRQIAIEICPASNQILGYVADLRNHPGIVYHRSGIPIVLSGDDPGSFGYNTLTVDFYLATMAWGLNLADLKQFAWNSIQYSSLPNNRKIEGLQKWQNEWNLFIDNSYNIACNQTYPNLTMNISQILPAYGPNNRSINVTVFGFGFEIAICKKIICKFGEKETNGTFIDLNEIVCPTPLNNSDLSTVSISIVIDNKIFPAGYDYKFISSLSVIDDEGLPPIIPSKSDKFVIINQKLIITLLILLFTFII